MHTPRTAEASSSPDHASIDLISQLVSTGLTSTFDSLKGKVAETIKDNGDQYLADSLKKLKDATSHLSEWAKKNPMKMAIAVAAIIAVTGFLVSAANSSNEEDGEAGAGGPKGDAKGDAKDPSQGNGDLVRA